MRGPIFWFSWEERSVSDIKRLLEAAVEASLYIQPAEHGLTHAELLEIATRAGFGEGEVRDALPSATIEHRGEGPYRYQFSKILASVFLLDFGAEQDPDFRNIEAFQFVFDTFEDARKRLGKGFPSYSLDNIRAKAEQAGLETRDVEVAVMAYLLVGQLKDRGRRLFLGAFARRLVWTDGAEEGPWDADPERTAASKEGLRDHGGCHRAPHRWTAGISGALRCLSRRA